MELVESSRISEDLQRSPKIPEGLERILQIWNQLEWYEMKSKMNRGQSQDEDRKCWRSSLKIPKNSTESQTDPSTPMKWSQINIQTPENNQKHPKTWPKPGANLTESLIKEHKTEVKEILLTIPRIRSLNSDEKVPNQLSNARKRPKITKTRANLRSKTEKRK